MEKSSKKSYLYRSRRICQWYLGLFGLAFISSLLKNALSVPLGSFTDLLMGGPLLVMMFLSPAGLYFSWKSMRLKEGNAKWRFGYFFWHMLMLFLFLALFFAMFQDIRAIQHY